MLNVKIEGELAAEIEKQARREKKTKPALVRHAVAKYIEDSRAYQKWKLRKIKLGLADVKAGRTIPHGEVVRMLDRARAARARKKAA